MSNKSNRRQFLQTSARAALGTMILPTVIPSSALGLNGTTPPSDRIVMGSIGTGSQGTSNMKNFLRFKEVRYVALCDVDANRLDQARNIVNTYYGNTDCRSYEDYRELLEKEKLDGICISVPDHWHSLTYIAAAEKKINIWGEKPLARSICEGQAIVKAVQKNDVIWQTGSWQRSVEIFRHAAELVFNGRIGKVKYVEVGLPEGTKNIGTPPVQEVPEGLNWEFWLGPAPKVPYRGVCHWDWRWILDYSGGQLTDWAGHHIDIAHWGLGLDRTGPVEVEGIGVYPEEGIFNAPVKYDFLCQYANGLHIRVASASRLRHGMGATWFGETGWIHVTRGRIFASDPKILEEKMTDGDTRLYKSDDHFANLLECIKTHKETITPVDVAHRSISVGLLGEIAMTTGQKIKWDPEKEEIIGNERASRLLNRPLREPWELPTI
ncbi:MAG: Gfo/Idh/MocA family oxidoreductase [Mangrovibacterium sp.]|nr:Gfo/Idh/MocA family oxidoreductase [Mangrovibacterium sp.]